MTTINYTTDDNPALKNPEGGLFHNRIPDPTRPPRCFNTPPGDYHTLLPAYLYLDTACDTDLVWNGYNGEGTSTELNDYATKLVHYRSKGVKVVFRPRYDDQGSDHGPNRCGVFHTDKIERLHNHIDAVAKMLNDYKDVVAFIQAGYLGRWGEWNTDDHPNSTAPFLYDYAIRTEIIDHVLMEYAQYQIKQDVELRRPVFAREVIDRAEANGEPRPNVGLQNDCFMTDEEDVGTYSTTFDNSPVNFGSPSESKAWAKSHTADHSFGGETCNHGGDERWRDCDQMRNEPATLHLNYLNGDYSQHAIDVWCSGNCFNDILRKIGYRFEVKRVEYTPTVAAGGSFTVMIDIENSGWAKLHKPRTAEVVLRSSSTPPQRYTPSNSATAEWAPAPPDAMTSPPTTRLTLTDAAPTTPGTYSVRLAIPDPDVPTDLAEDDPTRISYAVKLASLREGKNVFDANTGENDLGATITVQ